MGRTPLLFAVAAFLLPVLSQAYLPPSYYVYSHLTEQRAKSPMPSLQFSVSRPLGAGTEEVLGSFTLPNWRPTEGGWPSLSLLLSGDSASLTESVAQFGIPVSRESDLLRLSKEQAAALKEPPRPFYKPDKRMSLKRYRQTYAWVHKENQKSVWIEKDTFLPLKVEGPCPEPVGQLNWSKPGENVCELEFRNVYSLRRGSPQNSRITLWKDGQPILFFSIDRVVAPKANGSPGLNVESKVPPEISAIADILLH